MQLKTSSLLLALMLGFSLPTLAADAPAVAATTAPATAAAQFVREVEGIREYRLPNGLRILLAPDATKPTTTVNLTYLVGSRHEHYGETGMAHLLEHLLFKGTPSLPDGALDREMSRRGMRNNASTWYDRTNYFEVFPASEDNLNWALQMEADRMINSYISKKDLDSEMTVVRNEMERGENNPSSILLEKMAATAYQWHNYGKDTIGARADVENVRIENLQAFYRKYYQPDNVVLAITGAFDEQRALIMVQRHFGPLAKPSRELMPTWTRDPVQDGAREVVLKRVGENPLLAVLYHIAPAAHPDFAATELLAHALADTPSGRLHKALVEKGLAAGVGFETMGLKEPGFVVFFAQLAKGQSVEAARKAMLQELEGLASKPITEAEIKRAKQALANGFEQTSNDPAKLGIALSEFIAAGDWRLFHLQRDRIAAAKAAEVQQVAQNYLRESNRTFGQFIPTAKPQRASIPDAPDTEKMLADYRGNSAVTAGEVFDPTPEQIDARTERSELRPGFQLALLPKKTRGAVINGQLVLNYGDAKSLQGRSFAEGALAGMLLRGAGKLDRQAIQDQLQQLRSKLSINSDSGVLKVQFETRRDSLPALLDLLRDVLRKPNLPAAEFQRMKTEWLAGIDEQRSDPGALAELAITRHDNPWPKGDPRYAYSLDEQAAEVKALQLKQLQAFHRDFYGASNAQFALVGDFEAGAVKTQLKQLFGDWQSKQSYARLAQPYRADKPATLSLQLDDKASANHVAALAIKLRDSDADYPALAMAVHILGGDIPSRLWQRIREKDGLSYGVYATLQADSEDDAYSQLKLEATFAPENRSRIETAYREELERLLRDGVTEQELAEAKKGLLQASKLLRSQDGRLSGALAAQLKLRRTMAFGRELEAKIEKLTVAEVNAALQRYIQPAAFVHVYAGDFAKVGKHAGK